MFPECVSNGFVALSFSKSPIFGVFLLEKLVFFRKRGFKGAEREKKVRKRLKLFYCLNNLETFQMLVFLVKKDFFEEEP